MSRFFKPGFLLFQVLLFVCCGIDPSSGPRDPVPDASFTFTPASPAVGQEVQFTDTSTENPTNWQWDFGDGTSSTAQNPSHAFTSFGVKTVSLTATNGSGSDRVSLTISVAALAASFTFRPFLPSPGRSVQFSDTSVGGPTSWRWDFGDGTSSQAQNASHTYVATGEYPVTLTATNSNGTSSTVKKVLISTTDVLTSDRRIDWTYAGIPGGIPERAFIFRTLDATASSADINSALASCPSGQVVLLAEGTYNIGQITFGAKTGVTLRGGGPGKTIINSTASSAIVCADLNFMEADGIAIADDGELAQGSNRIVLASVPTAAFRVGNLIQITQDDSPNALGSPGLGVFHRSGFPGVWGMSTTRNLRYTSRITGVSGNSISLATPIPFPFSPALRPKAYPLRNGPGASLCGIEGLTIQSGSADRAIDFSGVDRCWLKDVEVQGLSGTIGMIYFRHSSQCEIRRCFVHDARGFPNQGDGYAFFLYYGCSSCLVVDNIASRVGAGVFLNGASANAIIYNFITNVQRDGHAWVDQGIIFNHGPHGIMNLIEGNSVQRIQNDGYHGSSSHNLLFRNQIHGVRSGAQEPRRPIDLCRGSYFHSVIGNVIGDISWTPAYYDFPANPSAASGIYILGFPGMDSLTMAAFSTVPWEGWTKSTNVPDPDVVGTLLRHGNFDFYQGRVVWDPDIVSQVLPDSMLYTSKPIFFGPLLWPPIGPDVPGLVTPIPAKARWDAFLATGSLDDLFRDI